MGKTCGVFWVWLVGSLLASGAHAQMADDPSAEPAEYQRQVQLAVEEFNVGNHEEARTRFLAAHAAYPNARSLRALGMVAYELRRYVESVHYLEQALASTERPLSAELREETRSLLNKSLDYVGEYTLLLDPAATDLWLDGERLRLADGEALRLAVGEYSLVARAPGHETLRRKLRVTGGTSAPLELQLPPLEQGLDAGRSGTDRADEPKSKRRRRALWVSLATVVIGGAVAGAVVATRPPQVAASPGGNAGAIALGPVE